MNVSERVNTSIELLYRKTFTDYIDDVSTEYMDPNDFDKYLTTQDALIARQIHDKTVGILIPELPDMNQVRKRVIQNKRMLIFPVYSRWESGWAPKLVIQLKNVLPGKGVARISFKTKMPFCNYEKEL